MSWGFFEGPSKLLDLFLWCLQAWEQKGNWKVLLAIIVSLTQGPGLLTLHWAVALFWTWLLCCLLSSCYSTLSLPWPHMSPLPCDGSLCPIKEMGHASPNLFWHPSQHPPFSDLDSRMDPDTMWEAGCCTVSQLTFEELYLGVLQMPQTYSLKGLALLFLPHSELS